MFIIHKSLSDAVVNFHYLQITSERVGRTFYRLLDNAGLDRVGVHTLRHTFASLLFAKGTDIKNCFSIASPVSRRAQGLLW